MIALIKQAIIDYLTSEMESGKTMSDFNAVFSGPVLSPPDVLFPYVSVYFDPITFEMPMGTSVPSLRFDGVINLEVYTQSGKSVGDAENECVRLFLSDDMEHGVIKALQKKFCYTVGTQPVIVIPSKQIDFRPGNKGEDAFTYAGRIALNYKTEI